MKDINEVERCVVVEKLSDFCIKWKDGKCNGYEVLCALRDYYEVEFMKQAVERGKRERKGDTIEMRV